ncbi:b51dc06a-d67d-40d2-852e-fd2122eb952c [Thermothielavioides terrestris]|uniref:Serum paraoxonase/arylesterase family protein n=2 Tax=Thermothielavioides terrestris TaxID=2587410 RepID=G2QXC2_THETT|nr:uncharacterized protein THITE_2108040 [Thermothielavioides terrestris NRRL 8126]AEO63145.1 hypothetical protein THITE_2108040 [Thermothielavioides terrestris NRRL 8126]SPQ21362.1 b51dc06a-d67d-40d2-852e-fd2122eb952c [Thermothielavioides terrestris]
MLFLSLFGALLAYALYIAGPFVHRRLTVLGVLRRYPAGSVYSGEVIAIPDTVHCEDVHYHAPSGTLFTACEDNAEIRFKWFPPLATFDDPELASRSQGSIHVVDPKTMKSRRLKFENFEGPFITHGIDVIPDPERPNGEAVYIFAVNHVPETQASGQKGPGARSQLEVFHHDIGSSSVKHLRSVWHPLIKTPNDIFAQSPTSIYVTNDHRHRYPGLMRTLEDFYPGAKWTEVVHIRLDSLAPADQSATAGVTGSIALAPIHNSNGLGHGRSDNEILIASCTSGVLHIGRVSSDDRSGNGNITLVDSIEFDHVVDNPSYFSDPYASSTTGNGDRSGVLETGLARAIDLSKTRQDPTAKDPVMVTYARPTAPGRWEKRVLLEDDGTRIRSGSAAVLVAIEPEKDKASRKAWLFVTGFVSQSMIAVKVDL